MKIISISRTQNFHPAIGWEFNIILNNGSRFKTWAEWFWYLFPEWDGNPLSLVNKKITQEWLKNYTHEI